MKTLAIILMFFLVISVTFNVVLVMDYRTLEKNDFSADELDFTRVAYQEGYFQALSDVFFQDIGLPYTNREVIKVCEMRSTAYKYRIKKLFEKSPYGLGVYGNTVDHQENMLIELIRAQPMIWTFSALHDRSDMYRCPWCTTLVPGSCSDYILQWVNKKTNKIEKAPYEVRLPEHGHPIITTEIKF